jgi:hypothetical protein
MCEDSDRIFPIFDGGGEFIKFSNGKQIRVKTAWVLGWERLLEYASPVPVSSI